MTPSAEARQEPRPTAAGIVRRNHLSPRAPAPAERRRRNPSPHAPDRATLPADIRTGGRGPGHEMHGPGRDSQARAGVLHDPHEAEQRLLAEDAELVVVVHRLEPAHDVDVERRTPEPGEPHDDGVRPDSRVAPQYAFEPLQDTVHLRVRGAVHDTNRGG